MTTEEPITLNAESGEQVAPAAILPGIGPTTTQGLSFGTGAVPIVPPLFINEGDATGSSNLASQLEQRLAEDGRFSGLLPKLSITADDATGHVTLSGPAPDPDLLPFLLATLRAAPGVSDVTNKTL